MLALTIHPEYAAAICGGLKTIEWRSRRTSHRGLIAIHASLPVGAIIGLAEITGCEEIGLPSFWPDLAGRALPGNVNPDPRGWPVAWLLAHARLLPTPITCRGKLGLWEIPREVSSELAAMMRQLGEAAALPG